MSETLTSKLPEAAISGVSELINNDRLVIKVTKERKTKHGDYRPLPNGHHQITVNSNLNPYRFLITLIHEIAHFEAYRKYGHRIKPHGREWKFTFQHLMLPFLNPDVFPDEILPVLAGHFKNPKASSNTDVALALALRNYDPSNGNDLVQQLPEGATFQLYNGRTFKKGKKRVKRYECVEIKTGKLYLFNPNTEVRLIEK
ncbi:MAG: sprT domain-containing protein [Flavobacteriaceae bacterium]|nr:sprT domain-containing protein [Flavobacteriaceae bacterium]